MPITIRRTSDPELIRRMLTHPKVFRWLFEDGADPADFQPVIDPAIWYLVAMDDNKPIAMFVFEPRTSVKSLVTLAIWPERWALAIPAFRLAVQFAFDRIGIERIVGEIPSDNRHAPRLARRSGFECFGIERKSFMRGGQLQDIKYFGASRDTWKADVEAQDTFCGLCGSEKWKGRKGPHKSTVPIIDSPAAQEVKWQLAH